MESKGRTITESVGRIDDLGEGEMKMTKVGDRTIVLARTASGVHALDNACPHQGYGLATGALDGELLTCQWHNWKFNVADGSCVRGEEAVACHKVSVVDGEVSVTITEPTAAEQRAALWPSLLSGIENDYVGQISRDAARLLHNEATPAEIMAEALRFGAPRTRWGVGHEMAQAADCLAWAEIRTGDESPLALIQGLSGISEVTRGYPVRPVPAPDPTVNFGAAIEAEDVEGAMAAVMASLDRGDEPAIVRRRFIEAVSQHHLSYGHGVIYTQKAFELLERTGWSLAPDLLPHLAASIGWATREDLLPYMRKAMRSIDAVDLSAMAEADERHSTGWSPEPLADELLAATEAPIAAAEQAAVNGAGVEGVLDAVTLAASRRLLRHSLDVEFDQAEDFGWLDITHALTLSRAARWAWQVDPGPHSARIALWAVWLVFDSGRSERRHGVGPSAVAAPDGGRRAGTGTPAGSLAEAVRYKDVAAALEWADSVDRSTLSDAIVSTSLDDQSGSFIVNAHLIKMAQAASEEAETLDSTEPLLATTRFLAAPRLERFTAANSAEALHFIRTGAPPKR